MSLNNRIFSSLGSSIEWFDFGIYGFFGPIFSNLFFSNAHNNEWESLLITYAIFAAGFASRPLGAMIFGYLGDLMGRVYVLRLTPILITLTTFLMAILPTYKTIGIFAPLFLLITRIAQGIFLGGEFSGNIVYLCESSTKWRFFWGSIGSFTAGLGMFLASATASLFYLMFSKSFMLAYGWRIAFLISIPIGILCFILRLNIKENDIFYNTTKVKNPLLSVFRSHKKTLFTCLGLIYLHATSYYFVFMFLPIALAKLQHIPVAASMTKNTGFMLFHICLIPVWGIIINYFGGLKSLKYIAALFFVCIVPIGFLISLQIHWLLILSVFALSMGTAFNAAVVPGLISKEIPTNIRYTILAIAFNIGFGIFGGTTPVICLLITNRTGDILYPTIYIAFAALITLTTGIALTKRKGNHAVR